MIILKLMSHSQPDPERQRRMEAALKSALNPEILILTDDSARHAGHHGHDGASGTHFTLEIAASCLDAHSRIEKQRRINDILREEFASGLHALAIKIVQK